MSEVAMSTPAVDAATPDLGAMPLGELARRYPQALGLLRRLRLDYCCGGARTLRDAAQERELDVAALQREIGALQPADIDAPAQPAEMTRHIVRRYHDAHRAQLPELALLARKVERVHREHPQVPAGLGELLEQVHRELLEHMQKEETILFPMMQQVPAGTPLPGPIARMRDEHEDHGRLLLELRRLTRDGELPPDACNSWRALYAGVASFAEDLIEHIHTENNVLFPMFEPAARA